MGSTLLVHQAPATPTAVASVESSMIGISFAVLLLTLEYGLVMPLYTMGCSSGGLVSS